MASSSNIQQQQGVTTPLQSSGVVTIINYYRDLFTMIAEFVIHDHWTFDHTSMEEA